MSTLAMSRAEREAFLAETHIGIISVAEPGRGPLTLPIWYRYEPGGAAHFATGAHSRKARLIEQAGRISLCVQSETPPYQYVSIEGPARIGTADPERDGRQIAIRYLGQLMGERYYAMLAASPEPTILVTITPERWYAVDYRKMGA